MIGRKPLNLRCKEPNCKNPAKSKAGYCFNHLAICTTCGKRIWKNGKQCRECFRQDYTYNRDLQEMLTACHENETRTDYIGQAAREVLSRWEVKVTR